MKSKFFITTFLISLLVISVFFRFSKLSSSPPGLYVDEASVGINAYQIAQFGVDEWNQSFPVYFKAFGEYKNPILIYTIAGIFKLVSPSITTIRVGSAIWGIIGIIALGFFMYTSTRSTTWALLAALLLSIMPWHFHLSRIVFEPIVLPATLTITLIFLHQFQTSKKTGWFLLSAISLGFMWYSYTSARLYAPLFFLALIPIYKPTFKQFLIGLFAICITMIPALTWEITHPGSLLARYNTVKLSDESIQKKISHGTSTYLHQFNYQLWFTKGDTNLRHTPATGMLPYSLVIPFLFGLFYLTKNRIIPTYKYLLLILITAPLAASLTSTNPNALRMIHLAPILIIISILGIRAITNKNQLIGFFTIFLFFIESSNFLHFYFSKFPDLASDFFDTPFVEALAIIPNSKTPLTIVSSNKLYYNGHYATYQFLHIDNKASLPPKPTIEPLWYNPYSSQLADYFFLNNSPCPVESPLAQTSRWCLSTYPPLIID